MHKFGVVIGRFQPFHSSHLELVRFALKESENLIVVLGSDNQASTIANPWSSEQRSQMIRSALTPEENKRVEILRAKDYLYNNNLWVTAVQEMINNVASGSDDIKLIGHEKDRSSFYLKLFPQWGAHLEFESTERLDGTSIREALFRKDTITIKPRLPKPVYEYLVEFMKTPEYDRLYDEFHQVLSDKAEWEGSPYQPTFVTTDAVCIASGHILVVRRGGKYGKGLIALPGGYIKATEKILTSCIRELKEETEINLDKAELKKLIIDSDVFDHPHRDLRGRVITHAFCFRLPDGKLPRVKGADDADKAWWMPLRDVAQNEPEFFADHYHIINRFIYRDRVHA